MSHVALETRPGVDVWHFDAHSLTSRQISTLAQSLDPAEAAALDTGAVRQRARLLARGALRWLLGRYLEVPVALVRIGHASGGKPMLADPAQDASLQFNLSHSGNHVVLAFGRCGELGVDIERRCTELDVMGMARRFFAPEEVAALERLATAEKRDAFFRAWTHKEAYLKARGIGFGRGLDHFAVDVGPDHAPRLIHDRQDDTAPSTWRLHDLGVVPGHAAALAVAADIDVHLRAWSM